MRPPTFSELTQLYFTLIITIVIGIGTLPSLKESILTYGKLDDAPPSTLPSLSNGDNNKTATSKINSPKSLVRILGELRVPKYWFAHFYTLAPLCMIYLSVDLFLFTATAARSCQGHHPLLAYYPYFSLLSLLNYLGIMIPPPTVTNDTMSGSIAAQGWIPPPETILVMTCYLLQGIRRWYETTFVERPSPKATMNIGHYLVGLTFYSAMAPTVWVDAYEAWATTATRDGGIANSSNRLSTAGIIQCLIGFCIFAWGSWHQYNCHVILANLRSPASAPSSTSKSSASKSITTTTTATASTTATATTEYKVPFGDWFQYLVTPHYSAEMVLYFGFYVMASAGSNPAPTMLIAWIWVVINLGIVARETDQWYRSKFGEHYYKLASSSSSSSSEGHDKSAKGKAVAPRRRAILIPFVY